MPHPSFVNDESFSLHRMLIGKFLTLVVIISGCHLIHAEVIRGVDMPTLDTMKMTGKWYRLTYLKRDIGLSSCSTNIIERQSDDKFTMTIKRIYTPGPTEIIPQDSDAPTEFVIHATIQKDTNVLVTVINGVESAMVLFDVEYDSHIAVYTTPTREQLFAGRDGFFFLLSRQKTLPAEIVEQVRRSSFVQEGLELGVELILLDTTDCE